MISNNVRLKVLIVHPEKQHSIKTLAALQKSPVDCDFITSFYFKRKSYLFKLSHLLPKSLTSKLNSHTNINIDDASVYTICTFRYLLTAVIRLLDVKRNIIGLIYPRYLKVFNDRVLKHIISERYDVVITYDTLSGELLHNINTLKNGPKTVVDMSAASYPFMIKTYKNNYLKESDKLYKNISLQLESYRYLNSLLEFKYGDYFLAASLFTKNSVIAENVSKDKIKVVRYGIDISSLDLDRLSNEKARFKGSKCAELNILYVGNVSFEKGIYTLIDAINIIGKDKVKVTLVGEYKKNNFNLNDAPSNFNFVGRVAKDNLSKFYLEADLLIQPSLCDGFGFVVVEALSHGLPVICSNNVGAAELLTTTQKGIVFETGQSKDLACVINRVLSNEIDLNINLEEIKSEIEALSWDNYGIEVYDFLKDITENKNYVS
jgi:glycosyltransferase involved in cell wall biosynthesis